jgi:hypothetical protein
MVRERIIRLVAGTLVLISLALGIWVNRWWFLLTAFVGLNLFQSALTRWCLLGDILRVVFKVRSEAEKQCVKRDAQARRNGT